MIGVSKLLCGTKSFCDQLRYVNGASIQESGVSKGSGCRARAAFYNNGDYMSSEDGRLY